MVTGLDIIGDVHACASLLKARLTDLGYAPDETTGVYRHPERRAVFVGDLIDRGPEQLEALQLVKAMADSDTADVVMGNHEFNAITYATKHPKTGEFLRAHNEHNASQHSAFLNLSEDDQRYYIDWFKTLPLWLDLGGVRVVHACWHPESMRAVIDACGSNRLTTVAHYAEAVTKDTELHAAVEVLLKGPEIDLEDPYGLPPFKIGGPKLRREARIRWWKHEATTLRDLAELRGATLENGDPYPVIPPDILVDPEVRHSYLYTDSVPLFYGHYWRDWEPVHKDDWTTHTACVDFSAERDGTLVAYRWTGEPTITWRNYRPHTTDVVEHAPSQ